MCSRFPWVVVVSLEGVMIARNRSWPRDDAGEAALVAGLVGVEKRVDVVQGA